MPFVRPQTIAVIGTGTIGASWSALFLAKGHRVIATDTDANAEDRLRKYIASAWTSTCTDNADIPWHNLTFERDVKSHLPSVDFVQENGPETLEFKKHIFSMLDANTDDDTPLVSSSSGLPSSQFISGCKRNPSRILIGHPFNPPHLLPLVEIVPNPQTSQTTIDKSMSFYRHLGRKPVLIKAECPGFVGNRLQAALVHEAYSLVKRDIVSANDIDTIVSNSIALRWAIQGPFITKVLGGGGNGTEGFRKHLASVGKAAGVWAADMKKHAYDPSIATERDREKLVESVSEELKAFEKLDLSKQRDGFLRAVLELKEKLKNTESP